MRNLKRALSLLLSSTMVLGMLVMGSSAASYADVTSKQHEEAIEVLKTVGIMTGDENGKFNPEAKVTRNEMAVVMSNLMAYNVKTYANTSPFTDVPEWAEPYVAACYTNGITSGYDKVTYGGNDSVTTGQAALMVMKALGYFQYQSDFGADWQLSTVAQGNKIDLFDDVDSGVKEAMTRNDVAQLVLNALEAGTVEAEKNGQDINVGDISITSGVTYKYVTSGKDYAKAINDNQSTSANSINGVTAPIVELGEKLYQGDLTKASEEDDFGRPATKWEYQAKEIGTFADKADHVFTASVTSKELYDAVGKTATGAKYDWSVAVNGDYVDYDGADLYANRNDNDADFYNKATGEDDVTGNGVITEVFVDGTAGEESVHIAVINQYAAEVLKVDKDDKTITLSDLDNGPAKTSDTFDTADFEEDDIVVYTYAEGEIQSVYAAEKLEGEVTRVRSNTTVGVTGNGDNFVVDGTTYKYNMTVSGAERLTSDAVSNDVVAYLDAQGYVVYIDESAVSYDYAYVLTMGTDGDKFDNSQNNNKSETVYARLVLTDGTIVKVETDAKKSEIANLRNQLVAYSVDKNDVYTLNVKGVAKADVADAVSDVKIENGKAGFKAYKAGNSYSANSNTVFIVVDSDDKYDDYDVTVYTGIKNVPDIDAIANKTVSAVALDNKGAVAKVVYIEDGDVSGTEQVIYAIANTNAKIQKDKENGEYYEITAVVNGEIKTLNVKAGSNSAVNALVKNVDTTNAAKISGTKYVVALKSITENADGFITSAKVYAKLDADNDGVLDTSNKLYVTGTMKAENGTVGLANKYYAYSDDVIVARWDLDDQDVELSRINSVKNDSNDVAVAVMDGNTVIGLFIIEVKGGEGENNTPVVDTEVNVDGRYEAIYKDAGITTTVKGDKITFNVNRKALKEFINNPANKTDVAEMIGGEHGRENNLWVGASFKAPEGATTAEFKGDVTGTDNVESGYVYLWSAVADGSKDAGWTVKTQDASRTFTITWKNTQGKEISKDTFTVAVDIQ
ncbi:S-layer homology domain-containing protein [Pseudoflavonifractor sp. P01025]|uniref:S-layer homology domain-containing protein n=1 Tax=Flintibacter porci TaxID=3342383 RepID=UPI0035B65E51